MRKPINRRGAILVLTGGLLAAGFIALTPTPSNAQLISPIEAQTLVNEHAIVLIDIRRPDEWTLTGVAQGATPIDLRDSDFLEKITRLVNGDKARGVALICARGVRSRKTAARLEAAGFSNILDVTEGMLGSAAGPGWIGRGLPLTAYPAN